MDFFLVNGKSVSILDQKEAQSYDEWLMSEEVGYSIDQLMELAGLGVAMAVMTHLGGNLMQKKILLCIGPGNNGGDGIVAARHLARFGFDVTVIDPKSSSSGNPKGLRSRIGRQLAHFGVKILTEGLAVAEMEEYDIVVDALFGFGFHGEPREPYKSILAAMTKCKRVVSVDVPSGWDVDGKLGDPLSLQPEALISLMLPKKCSVNFQGKSHYITGHFAPPQYKSGLKLPEFNVGALVAQIEDRRK